MSNPQPKALENVNHEDIQREFNTLVGQSMELVESLGLPEKQEKAFKSQLKRLIYSSLDVFLMIESEYDSPGFAEMHDKNAQ